MGELENPILTWEVRRGPWGTLVPAMLFVCRKKEVESLGPAGLLKNDGEAPRLPLLATECPPWVVEECN